VRRREWFVRLLRRRKTPALTQALRGSPIASSAVISPRSFTAQSG
jgi:hypothetical protein